MTIAANRRLIETYFDLVLGRRGDIALDTLFSEDVSWQVPASNPHIQPNPRHGRAAVMDLLTSGVGVYQAGSLSIDLQRLVVDEQHAVAQFTLRAKLADGRPYRNNYCFVFALRAGLICGVWEYLDTLAQAQQGTWDALAP
ncbi:nuclear transport factor 2 family protein [Parahaliea mediterranea]|uniref:nuclear transport factor 2 family protein n=1 Tax=Parahaliea mediterranea TaxID=651086 RepID=UPI000E2E8687|nr:nuclear transport factor 2 family protein [Parahaliea mediterranea]